MSEINIFEELKAIGTSLKRIGMVLETGATVEAKRSANADDDEKPAKRPTARAAKPAVEPEAEIETDDDDADFVTASAKKPAKSAAASFDEEGDDVEVEEPPAKKPAAKKITLDDVNDACKARAAGGKREEVLGILQKKFKVTSVTALKDAPDKWPQVIKAMSL